MTEHSLARRPILLFDVMDTLVYNPFNREIPQFFGLTHEQLARENNPHAWDQFERGEISEQDYLSRYFRDGRPFDHAAFKRSVDGAYRWLHEETSALLRWLKDSGYELHAFSNYPCWYLTIEERLGLSQLLSWTFVSCRTGVRKPSLAAFRGVVDYFGLPAAELLFIDDCVANCDAASQAGIDAILYTDLPALRESLRARHIGSC